MANVSQWVAAPENPPEGYSIGSLPVWWSEIVDDDGVRTNCIVAIPATDVVPSLNGKTAGFMAFKDDLIPVYERQS